MKANKWIIVAFTTFAMLAYSCGNNRPGSPASPPRGGAFPLATPLASLSLCAIRMIYKLAGKPDLKGEIACLPGGTGRQAEPNITTT